ncbi:hypothetical protein D3C84_1259960 [compost metagenome]
MIVKKGTSSGDGEKLAYDKTTKKLHITTDGFDTGTSYIIGAVIEERFNGN